jgi:hypothetical protein
MILDYFNCILLNGHMGSCWKSVFSLKIEYTVRKGGRQERILCRWMGISSLCGNSGFLNMYRQRGYAHVCIYVHAQTYT